MNLGLPLHVTGIILCCLTLGQSNVRPKAVEKGRVITRVQRIDSGAKPLPPIRIHVEPGRRLADGLQNVRVHVRPLIEADEATMTLEADDGIDIQSTTTGFTGSLSTPALSFLLRRNSNVVRSAVLRRTGAGQRRLIVSISYTLPNGTRQSAVQAFYLNPSSKESGYKAFKGARERTRNGRKVLEISSGG